MGRPGIAGRFEPRVLCGRSHGKLVHIQLTDNNGTGLSQFINNESIVGRDKILQDSRGTRRSDTLGTDQVFYGYRDAGEGSTLPFG